jgi:hypothetical protein
VAGAAQHVPPQQNSGDGPQQEKLPLPSLQHWEFGAEQHWPPQQELPGAGPQQDVLPLPSLQHCVAGAAQHVPPQQKSGDGPQQLRLPKPSSQHWASASQQLEPQHLAFGPQQLAPQHKSAGGAQQLESPWLSGQLKVAGSPQHSLPAQPLAGGWQVVPLQLVTVAAQTLLKQLFEQQSPFWVQAVPSS